MLNFDETPETAKNSTTSNHGGFKVTTPISSTENQSPEVDNGPVVALGILLALSMVLLAAVTIGWVTTYLIMKKREVAKNFLCNSARMDNGTGATVNTEDNDEDERYFQNPTYGEGGPSTNTRTGTTTTGDGAMYAVVDQLSRRTRPTAVTTENSQRQDSNGTTPSLLKMETLVHVSVQL